MTWVYTRFKAYINKKAKDGKILATQKQIAKEFKEPEYRIQWLMQCMANEGLLTRWCQGEYRLTPKGEAHAYSKRVRKDYQALSLWVDPNTLA